jgi:hypothetical protein
LARQQDFVKIHSKRHHWGDMNTNVVGMIGGLGNQLFQLAFGNWLERETNRKTVYDLSAYRTTPAYFSLSSLPESVLPRKNFLRWYPYPGGKFPVLAKGFRILRTPRYIVTEGPGRSPLTSRQLSQPAWFYGYWQSEVTTLPSIPHVRDALRPSAPVLATVAEGIALHVRRGDMVRQSATVDTTYFFRALNLLKDKNGLTSRTPIRIFSDDPEWCKQNLNLPTAIFTSNRTAFQDLTEMAAHEFLILSGSTFSWWAANLRDRMPGTVVAPNPIMPNFDTKLENTGWLRVDRG